MLVESLVIVGINAVVIFLAGGVLGIPAWFGITISILFWAGVLCVLYLLLSWVTKDSEGDSQCRKKQLG